MGCFAARAADRRLKRSVKEHDIKILESLNGIELRQIAGYLAFLKSCSCMCWIWLTYITSWEQSVRKPSQLLNVSNRSPALCHCSKTVFPCESGVSSDRDGVMAGKMSGHMFVVNGYENAVIDINKRQTKGGSK